MSIEGFREYRGFERNKGLEDNKGSESMKGLESIASMFIDEEAVVADFTVSRRKDR